MDNTNNTNCTKNINTYIKIAIVLVFILLVFSLCIVHRCNVITCESSSPEVKVRSAEICNKQTEPAAFAFVSDGCCWGGDVKEMKEKVTSELTDDEVNNVIELLSFWVSLWIGVTSCIISLLAILFTYNQHENNKEFKAETEKLEGKYGKMDQQVKEIEQEANKRVDILEDRLKKNIQKNLNESTKKIDSSTIYNRITATTSFLCQTLDSPTSFPEDNKYILQKILLKTIYKEFNKYLRYLSIHLVEDKDFDDEVGYVYLVLNNIGATINRTRINITNHHNIIYFDRCVNEIRKTIQKVSDGELNRENVIKQMTYIRDCLDCFIIKLE